MGLSVSRFLAKWLGRYDDRILLLGLDAAGKTTLLYRLKLGEIVHTVPTVGFNVEQVSYKRSTFTMWDVGGQDKIRPLWRHYFHGTDALIFMVDSNDIYRLDEATCPEDEESAAEALHKLLKEEELRTAKLLVLANKQDLPQAVSSAQLADRLRLFGVKDRAWKIQGCCATTGEGVYEGLDWLVDELHGRGRRRLMAG